MEMTICVLFFLSERLINVHVLDGALGGGDAAVVVLENYCNVGMWKRKRYTNTLSFRSAFL